MGRYKDGETQYSIVIKKDEIGEELRNRMIVENKEHIKLGNDYAHAMMEFDRVCEEIKDNGSYLRTEVLLWSTRFEDNLYKSVLIRFWAKRECSRTIYLSIDTTSKAAFEEIMEMVHDIKSKGLEMKGVGSIGISWESNNDIRERTTLLEYDLH